MLGIENVQFMDKTKNYDPQVELYHVLKVWFWNSFHETYAGW